MGNFVGATGLTYLWGKIKSIFATKEEIEDVVSVADDDGTGGSVEPATTLSELSDTNISNPSNGQALVYNSNSGKWENSNTSGGGGSGEENVIEVVKVNGSALTPDANKAVDVTVPTESTVSGWGFTKNTGTYSKPSGGIPSTDLASAVQTSLGKADTAMQAFIYDIDASNLDEYGEKFVESSTPYTAIHAAYQAGKTIYVRLTNNTYYPYILNMVSTNGNTEGGYEFTAMVQNGGATFTAHVDIGASEYYVECHQKFFLEDETDPTVPSWAKASSKPSYTASEVGAVDVNDVVTIYSGSSTPSSSLGSNGDIYIKTS